MGLAVGRRPVVGDRNPAVTKRVGDRGRGIVRPLGVDECTEQIETDGDGTHCGELRHDGLENTDPRGGPDQASRANARVPLTLLM